MARLFCLLIFILNLSNAAAGNFDSLLRVSLRLQSDTERVNLFYAAGFGNRIMQPGYAMKCARQALFIARRSNSFYHMGKAENLLGILFFRRNDLSSALGCQRRALQYRRQAKDEEGMAMSQINLGNIYSALKNYALAERSYLQALQLLKRAGSAKQQCNCMINLGVLHADLGNYEAAKNYLAEALHNAKARFDYELEAMCLNNLSEVHLNEKDFEAAIACANNSIKMKDLMDNELEKSDSYLSLAKIYLRKEEPAEAERMLKIADSINVLYDYFDGRMEALRLRAELYKSAKDFKQAFAFLERYQSMEDSVQKVNQHSAEMPEWEEGSEPADKHNGFSLFYFNLILIPCMATAAYILSLKR